MPCVGANNTLSSPSPSVPPPSFPQSNSSSPNYALSTSPSSNLPFMKFLIKLLHFFTLSGPLSDDDDDDMPQKGTSMHQQQQQQQHASNGKLFNALPPFAYTTALIFFIQLISVIFVLNIEEFSSPLVMFSYWRNKIS